MADTMSTSSLQTTSSAETIAAVDYESNKCAEHKPREECLPVASDENPDDIWQLHLKKHQWLSYIRQLVKTRMLPSAIKINAEALLWAAYKNEHPPRAGLDGVDPPQSH